MYGLKMDGGDIAVSAGGVPAKVTGIERIKQEVAAWLIEPLGTDPMYPLFGSRLREMIGSAILSDITADIREEVRRVINNYIEYQISMLKAETSRSSGTDVYKMYSATDLVTDVQDILVQQEMDSVYILVTLNVSGGQVISVSQQIAN